VIYLQALQEKFIMLTAAIIQLAWLP